MRRAALRGAALALPIAALVLALIVAGRAKDDPPSSPNPERVVAKPRQSDGPNVIFIYSDDQDERTFTREYMPNTFRLLVRKGTRFKDAMTATPVCCPSRVGYLSGQYPHNNGVFSNSPGYVSFKAPQNNLAAWMSTAGYRTGWIGKFLQEYEEVNDLNDPAPGFNDWAIINPSTYFGFELFEPDRTREPRGYLTDVLTRKATQAIRRGAIGDQPLFLTVNYLAPHKDHKGQPGRCNDSAEPAPQDLGSERGLRLPKPPSFKENTDDKELYGQPERLRRDDVRTLKVKHRCRVESLRALDRGIAKLHSAVMEAGELDNTIFIFTSDNGLLMGEHNLDGKGRPYEEGLQVPLVIRVPPNLLDGTPVDSSSALVANVDLAPTILDLAGTKPCIGPGRCRRLDGRSLVPLIEGSDDFGADREILIEGSFRTSEQCDFRGIRTPDTVLIQRAQGNPKPDGCQPLGKPELYDLSVDPFQLDNLGSTDPQGSADLRRALLERLDKLERCSGIEGRDRDLTSPFCG